MYEIHGLQELVINKSEHMNNIVLLSLSIISPEVDYRDSLSGVIVSTINESFVTNYGSKSRESSKQENDCYSSINQSSSISNVNRNSGEQIKMIRALVILTFVILLILIVVLAQFEDDQSDLNEAWFTDDMYNSSYFANVTAIKYGIIAPGTKWCGQGSKAEDYTALGKFIKTDSCCRAHDNCDIVIEAGATLYNLTNPDKSSRLSCECDKEFHLCLKEIQDIVSKTIGTIYFDILQKKCLYMKNESFEWRDNEPYSNSKFIKFIRKLFS